MRLLAIVCSLITLMLLSACSRDDQENQSSSSGSATDGSSASETDLKSETPSLRIPAGSKTQICENMIQGERVQYRVDFSDKLHFGVSVGQDINANAPVPMHITRSEVRTFTVKVSGDYCFHFDNQQAEETAVTLSHKRL